MKNDQKAFDDDGRFLSPKFREFVTCINTAEFERHAGIGLAPEAIIGEHRESFRWWYDQNQKERQEGHHRGVSDADLALDYSDQVVWEGSHVVAVLRANRFGLRELVVDRYDPDAPQEPSILERMKDRHRPRRQPDPARDAALDDEMGGVDRLHALADARRESLPPAWSVTEGEYLLYHSHHAMTLDEVIKEELEEGAAPMFGEWDRAVWQGPRLMAVLKVQPGGGFEAVRLDGEPPAKPKGKARANGKRR